MCARVDLGFGVVGVLVESLRCNGVTAQATQRAHKLSDGPGNSVKNSSQAGGASSTSSLIDGASVVKTEQPDQYRTAVGGRCIGRIRRADGQCTHRAKAGSEYCEKHSKTSTAVFSGSIGTSGPGEGPIDDKNLSKLVADLSLKDRKSFARARDLLCKYMNASLSSTKGLSIFLPECDGYTIVCWLLNILLFKSSCQLRAASHGVPCLTAISLKTHAKNIQHKVRYRMGSWVAICKGQSSKTVYKASSVQSPMLSS